MITSPFAQWALDHASRDDGEPNNPAMYFGILGITAVADTAVPVYMTSMSNPHIMSYAYPGLPPERFGMKKSIASRKQFQMMSSKSYQLGARIGGKRFAQTAGRVAFRAVPGLGWAMLAYDVYDFIANDRLFGVKL